MEGTWPTVRVFISSTFRDMQAERDHLVKVVFPVLREHLEHDHIHLVDIDLRWGVTQEQADNDRVLDLCLDQIQRCKPFFVGILGERYGWVPKEFPLAARRHFGWIQHHTGKSLTELEILHGVLNDPTMCERAFFYLRDSGFISQLSVEQRSIYCEGSTEEEIRNLPTEQAQACAEDRQAKLRDLKARIMAWARARDPSRVLENYPCHWDVRGTDPVEQGQGRLAGLESFGRHLLEHLEKAIRAAPELAGHLAAVAEGRADELAEELGYHEVFIESRMQVYVGRDGIHRQLLDYLGDERRQPLLLVGGSGSGKSAILARLCRELMAGRPATREPRQLVVPHFIGASPTSTNLSYTLRRFCRELRRKFNLRQEIPDDPVRLPATFREMLSTLPQGVEVVFIIDAVNQFDESGRGHEMAWLPPQLPPGVKVVVSCIEEPGRPQKALDALRARGTPELHVQSLTDAERFEIVGKVPSLSAKTLDPTQTDLLLSNPATANPLYLLVTLEEMRGFGSFEKLNDKIRSFPPVEGEEGLDLLFGQVLERLELEVGRNTVSALMPLVACSRMGLSESELSGLLTRNMNKEDAERRTGEMYVALRQLRPHLLRRGTLVDFYHRNLSKAVAKRYLDVGEPGKQRLRLHDELAEFFQPRGQSRRRIEELPWQLAQAKSWQRLYDLLADLTFLEEICSLNELDFRSYWAMIEANSSLTMVDAYRSVWEDPRQQRLTRRMITTDEEISGYLTTLPHLTPAEIEKRRQDMAGKHTLVRYQDHRITLANLFARTGHLKEAVILRTALLDEARARRDPGAIARASGNLAGVLSLQGDIEKASLLHREEEQFFRRAGDSDGLARAVGNQFLVYFERGDLQNAAACQEEEERLFRRLGCKRDLAIALEHRAALLERQGDLQGALATYQNAQRIFEEVSDDDNMAKCAYDQAILWQERGAADEAMRLFQRAEPVFRDLGMKTLLEACLTHQAEILAGQGDSHTAAALLSRAQEILGDFGERGDVFTSLTEHAAIFQSLGDIEAALRLYARAEQVARDAGNNEWLALSLGNRGVILKNCGRMEESLSLLRQAVGVSRAAGDREGLQNWLHNLGGILQRQGDLEQALALWREQGDICRELKSEQRLATSLGNQGGILHCLGQIDQAMALLKQQESLCRRLSDRQGLRMSLSNQAAILKSQGDLEGALSAFRKAEEVCREANDRQHLTDVLGNIGTLLYTQGDADGALAALTEAEPMLREWGDRDALQANLSCQGGVFYEKRDWDRTMRILTEQEYICRESGNSDGLQTSLGNQARVRQARGDLEGAVARLDERESVCRPEGRQEGLIRCLIAKATVLGQEMGRVPEAMPLVEEALSLAAGRGLPELEKQARATRAVLRSMARETGKK